jgi:hypothetical protein
MRGWVESRAGLDVLGDKNAWPVLGIEKNPEQSTFNLPITSSRLLGARKSL